MNEIVYLYQPIGIAFNLLIYIILMFLGYKSWKNPHKIRKIYYRFFIILLVIVCTFCYFGDYLHYFSFFTNKIEGKIYLNHLENIYQYFFKYSFGEYYFWRFIIWGTAIFLLCKMSQKLNLNPLLFLFIFLSFGFAFFLNGRVSLSMSILFYGISFLTQNKTKIFSITIGLLLIIISCFFHKSAFFGISILILSLICYKLNRINIAISICLIPIFIIIMKFALGNIFNLSYSGEANSSITSAQSYLQIYDFESHGPGMMVQQVLLWITMILWVLLIIKTIKNKIYYNWPLQIRILINFAFFSLLISSIFFFDLGFPTKIIQLRFAEFAYMPIAVLITVCRMSNFSRKLTKIAVTVGLVQCGYHLIYMLYTSSFIPFPQ